MLKLVIYYSNKSTLELILGIFISISSYSNVRHTILKYGLFKFSNNLCHFQNSWGHQSNMPGSQYTNFTL